MANVMRKRWDLRANPAWILEFRVLDATAVEIGDLMWMDPGAIKASPSNDVKPASHADLWTGSLAGTQGKLAEHFVGVAMESKVASDGKLTCRVACRGVFGLPVTTATTFDQGDLIAGSRNGGLNLLHAQQADKIADTPVNKGLAIGKATKRYTTNVSVIETEIGGQPVAGGGWKAFLSS